MCVDEIQLAERTARGRQNMRSKDQVEMDMRKLMEAICVFIGGSSVVEDTNF